jgi:hypothetical protein
VLEFESHHFCPQFSGETAAGASFVLLPLPPSRSRSRFLVRLQQSRCNSTAIGKGLARFRLHLPRISAEIPCGFPCPSAPLPRRSCWISAVRGDAFVRGVSDEGFKNRGVRERSDAAERARGTRSRSNPFRDGGDQESLVPGKGPVSNKRPGVYKPLITEKWPCRLFEHSLK